MEQERRTAAAYARDRAKCRGIQLFMRLLLLQAPWGVPDFSTLQRVVEFRRKYTRAEALPRGLLVFQLSLHVLQPGLQIVGGFGQPGRVVDDVRGKEDDQLVAAGRFW